MSRTPLRSVTLLLTVQSLNELLQAFLYMSHMFWKISEKKTHSPYIKKYQLGIEL